MAIKKVTISAIFYAQLVQNRFYLETVDSTLDERGVALDVKTHWFPIYRNLMIEDVRWFDITVQSVGGGAQLVHHEPISIGGGQLTETQTTPFACGVLLFGTGLAGKKFHGRMYSPGPRGGDFQKGFLTPGGVDLYTSVTSQLQANYCDDATSQRPVRLVIHGENESHDTRVTTITARSTYGVQRRRNVGVGQ